MTLQDKQQHLNSILSQFDSVAIAFSGGVDSTLLLKAAADTLGPDRVLALTATAAFFPNFETTESRRMAEQIGVRQQQINIDLLAIPEVAENSPRRCYYCKHSLFKKLLSVTANSACQILLDGSNLDDLADYRPGHDALDELQIASPLRAAGLSKAEIRQLSKQLGLPTWDKPAFACLASRIPYGTRITPDRLSQISRCEDWLRQQNLLNFRVRYHGKVARIEVDPSEMPRLLKTPLRQELIDEFKSAGFQYITLDLQGYRTGSMNETLQSKAEPTTK